jgi:hypothetical protein
MEGLSNFATKKRGSGALKVRLETETTQQTVTVDGVASLIRFSSIDNSLILGKSASTSTLLTTNTPFEFGDSNAGDDRNAIGALVKPFFYEDNLHTFFVEPAFDEVTIDRWEKWAIPEYVPGERDYDLKDFEVVPAFPKIRDYIEVDRTIKPPKFGVTDPLDPLILYAFEDKNDWVTQPETLVRFGDVVVAGGGGFSPEVFVNQGPSVLAPGGIGTVGTVGGGIVLGGPEVRTKYVVPSDLTLDTWNQMNTVFNTGGGFTVVSGAGLGQAGKFGAGNFGGLNNKIFKLGGI